MSSRDELKDAKYRGRFFGTTGIRIIVTIIAIAICSASISSKKSSISPTSYMSNKYNEEFVYRGKTISGGYLVSPSRFPEMEIVVLDKKDSGFSKEYIDNYYGEMTAMIVEEKLMESLKTIKSAEKVFIKVNSNFSQREERKTIESEYKLSDVERLFEEESRLIVPCHVHVHIYGDKNKLDELIDEAYQLFISNTDDEKIDNYYYIVDPLLLMEDEILNFYSNEEYYAVQNKFTEEKVYWEYFNKFGLTNERAYLSYEYFKNSVWELRDQWNGEN